jgi:acylphosphatase
VGFRYTTHRIASRYELTGFVRNVPDGSVEMLVQGSPQDIDGCIEDIKNAFIGYIRETTTEEVSTNPKYTDFRITF